LKSHTTLLITTFALLWACSDRGPADAPPEPPPAADPEHPILSGYEVYEQFCAACHDTGRLGAPVTGNPADWEDRSGLWVGVLAEHVKGGYLDMPAKGGASPLSDLSVTEAVEHMMLQTFPEKPAD
jgi:cytochrome c5